MAQGDEKVWKIDQPVGVRSQADQRSINIERQRAQFLGKVMREARRNKDLKGYLAVEAAGYKDRGIENVDDKNRRYLDKVQQDRFYGDRAVGPGQQSVGGAQQPAEGAQPTSRLDASSTPRMDVQQPAGGQQETPSSRTGAATPRMINGREALFAGNDDSVMRAAIADRDDTYGDNASPTGAQPAAPVAGQPSNLAKPKSFFDERASGRQAFVDTVRNQRSGEEGVTDKFSEQARKQGAALDLTPQQIQDTLDGQTELSPDAIAGRANAKKDKAYQKEFGDSDKQWAKSISNLPADQKAMLEGLSPQEKKDSLAKAAASRAEREETKTREKEGTGAPDTYNPLGEALDGVKKSADESIANTASRSEEFKISQESNDKARQEDQEKLETIRAGGRQLERDNNINQTLSGERSKYIDRTASLNLGAYDPSPFNNGDGKDLLPPANKIEGMSEKEIGDYVSTKAKIAEAKSIAFNEALGGETRKSKTNLIPLEGKELSDEPYTAKRGNLRPNIYKGKEYTRDAVSAIKEVALGGYTGPQAAGEMGRARDIKRAQAKILDAAAKTGYAIWNDKELMGDAGFSKMIGEDPRFKGKVPSGNGAPQAFIQPVKVDDLFNSLDKSQSRANLMTRPLMS